MNKNVYIHLGLENLFVLNTLRQSDEINKNREKIKNEIKKQYGCEKSNLDFNPRNEHIEKTLYKNKICYVVVSNK